MLLKIVVAPYIELHSQQVAYRSSYTIVGHKHCSIACLANSFEKSRKKDDIFNSNMGEWLLIIDNIVLLIISC